MLLSLGYLLVRWVLQVAVWRWRSSVVKELEIVVLRHELAILRRQRKRPTLSTVDRAIAGGLESAPAPDDVAILHRDARDTAAMASTLGGEMLDRPSPSGTASDAP